MKKQSFFAGLAASASLPAVGIMGPAAGQPPVVVAYNDPQRMYSPHWQDSGYQGGMKYASYGSPRDGSVCYTVDVYCRVPTVARFYVITDNQYINGTDEADGGVYDVQVDGVTVDGPANSFATPENPAGTILSNVSATLPVGQHHLKFRKLDSKTVYTQTLTLAVA